MKNIKTLTLGIIIGAVAAVSITALAEYVVVPNSFPVKVNGQTVQVEGYNINDSTYFKLRDVADAVGGFDVDFVDGTIMVKAENAPAPTVAPTTTPDNNQNTGIPNPMYIETETRGFVTNDEFQFKYDELYKTVQLEDIINKANEIVGSKKFVDIGFDIMDKENNYQVIFSNIDYSSVPVEKYYQLFYPWLTSLQQ